jgi:hypothetical protein
VLKIISHSFAALTHEMSCSSLEINLVFPRTHVLFSIYCHLFRYYILLIVLVIESLTLCIMTRYTISIKVVHEQSGKVEYERERLLGNRFENSLIC